MNHNIVASYVYMVVCSVTALVSAQPSLTNPNMYKAIVQGF
jgi:hypothetical protein